MLLDYGYDDFMEWNTLRNEGKRSYKEAVKGSKTYSEARFSR